MSWMAIFMLAFASAGVALMLAWIVSDTLEEREGRDEDVDEYF